MDPSYASSDDEAEAMAKLMGFSGFGSQGPAKKRKFNAAIDAVIDGEELEKLDKGGKRGRGSGGNNIPLGKPRVFGQSKPAKLNEDEIELGEEEDEDEDEAGTDAYGEGGARIGSTRVEGEDDDENPGPQYIDTSKPPPDEESRAAQIRIDEILAQQATETASQPSNPDSPKKKTKTSLPGQGMAHFMSALRGPPPGPPPTLLEVSQPQQPIHNYSNDQSHRQRGERNALWYVEYYDPSFNENPWARLEKNLGLQPLGTWLERPERRA